jgi:hypothetical protein
MDPQFLAIAFRHQAEACARLGSPFYQAISHRIAEDMAAGGASWRALEPYATAPERSFLPLRLLGAIHRLVLEGRLKRLARYYPSTGGNGDAEAAWPDFAAALTEFTDHLRNDLPRTVQTNEVTRCCALLPGFLEIARSTGLPLRLLELGSSAGLNLRWDRYRYQTAGGAWGPENSPVVFEDPYSGAGPPLNGAIKIAERRGCDLSPVDPSTPEGRLTLLSYVWPDQTSRFTQLAQAIEASREVEATVERADALDWLERELRDSQPGAVTVVFHSIVLLYLSVPENQRICRILVEAGSRATPEAPLAWLSMEPGRGMAAVYLTQWPGGDPKLIATAGYHGRPVMLTGDAG